MFHLRNTFTNILALEMASAENRQRAASVVSAQYIIACLTSSREVGLTDCSRGTPAHGLSESSRYRRRLPPGGLCLRARVCVWAFVGSRAPSAKLQQLRHCVCVGGCDRQTDRRTGGQCDASSDTRRHRSLQPVTAESTTLAPQRRFHAGAGRGGAQAPNRG